MYKLKKLNVIKIVETESKKDELLGKGFKLLEEIKSEENEAKKEDGSKKKGQKALVNSQCFTSFSSSLRGL